MYGPGHEDALLELHVVVHAIDDALLAVRVAIAASRVAHRTRCDRGPVLTGLGALAVALERESLCIRGAPVVGELAALSRDRGVGARGPAALAQ